MHLKRTKRMRLKMRTEIRRRLISCEVEPREFFEKVLRPQAVQGIILPFPSSTSGPSILRPAVNLFTLNGCGN